MQCLANFKSFVYCDLLADILRIYFVFLLAVGKYVQGWVIFSCSKGAS